ncbi:hypothetical protein R6Q59_012798 [Mikania micrantha]
MESRNVILDNGKVHGIDKGGDDVFSLGKHEAAPKRWHRWSKNSRCNNKKGSPISGPVSSPNCHRLRKRPRNELSDYGPSTCQTSPNPFVLNLDLNANPSRSSTDTRSTGGDSGFTPLEANNSPPSQIQDTFGSVMGNRNSTREGDIQGTEGGNLGSPPDSESDWEEGQLPISGDEEELEIEVAATIEVAEKVGINLAEQYCQVRAVVLGEGESNAC